MTGRTGAPSRFGRPEKNLKKFVAGVVFVTPLLYNVPINDRKESAMFTVTYGTYDRPDRLTRKFADEAKAEQSAFDSLGAEVGYTNTEPEWEIEIARVYRETDGEPELLNEFEY
jgi:hypothetical protein